MKIYSRSNRAKHLHNKNKRNPENAASEQPKPESQHSSDAASWTVDDVIEQHRSWQAEQAPEPDNLEAPAHDHDQTPDESAYTPEHAHNYDAPEPVYGPDYGSKSEPEHAHNYDTPEPVYGPKSEPEHAHNYDTPEIVYEPEPESDYMPDYAHTPEPDYLHNYDSYRIYDTLGHEYDTPLDDVEDIAAVQRTVRVKVRVDDLDLGEPEQIQSDSDTQLAAPHGHDQAVPVAPDKQPKLDTPEALHVQPEPKMHEAWDEQSEPDAHEVLDTQPEPEMHEAWDKQSEPDAHEVLDTQPEPEMHEPLDELPEPDTPERLDEQSELDEPEVLDELPEPDAPEALDEQHTPEYAHNYDTPELDTPELLDTQSEPEAPELLDTQPESNTPEVLDTQLEPEPPEASDTQPEPDTPEPLDKQLESDTPEPLDTQSEPDTSEALDTQPEPEAQNDTAAVEAQETVYNPSPDYFDDQDEELTLMSTPRASRKKSNKNKTRTRSRAGRVVTVLAAVLATLAVAAYLISVAVIRPTMGLHVYVNDIDVSLMKPEEAQALVMDDYYRNMDFQIVDSLTGDTYPVRADDFDFSHAKTVEDFYDPDAAWTWFLHLREEHCYETGSGDAVEKLVSEIVDSTPILDASTREHPRNAYVQYNAQENTFEIVPDTLGAIIDPELFEEGLYDNIVNQPAGTDFVVSEDMVIRAEVGAEDRRVTGFCAQLNSLRDNDVSFTIGENTESITLADYHDLITLDNTNFTYQLDLRDYITEFVDHIYHTYYTLGVTRNISTTRGGDVSVSGGNWGNVLNVKATEEALFEHFGMTDEADEAGENGEQAALMDLAAVALDDTPEEPTPVELIWEQADDVKYDYRSNYIEVDLSNQHMYAYKDGELVLESDVVSGTTPGHTTPGGIYRLTYKARNQTLRGADYESFVNYWMPFNFGIGFHDATWRSVFGGNIYTYSGSHGCVNMPLAKAASLYDIIDSSFAIICYWR